MPRAVLVLLLPLLLAAGLMQGASGAGGIAPDEPHRPRIHFTPSSGWMNDPNGLVFDHGVYHLFYQYYPASTVWGPMHWGHATSRDLVHWQDQAIALYPQGSDYVFSGSAVVDADNSAGFGRGALVALFTNHDWSRDAARGEDSESQHLAYSVDGGLSFTRYAGNPVMPNPGGVKDIRDPKLFWHAPSHAWIAALAVGDHMELWRSADLRRWTQLSEFGREFGSHAGVWECPDLFPLPLLDADGKPTGETRWVLLQNIAVGAPNGGSGTQYFVGNFDGRAFTLDPDFAGAVRDGHALWLDAGRDNYAGVTWGGLPHDERVMIGWMSDWDYALKVPTGAWRGAMTLPTRLTLRRTPQGLRLFSWPVKSVEMLRQRGAHLRPQDIAGALDLVKATQIAPSVSDMEFEFTRPDTGQVGVELANARGERLRIGFDATRNAFFVDRRQAGDAGFSDKFAPGIDWAARVSDQATVRLRVVFDVASAELFADGGAVRMTETFFPSADFDRARLFAEGGPLQLRAGTVYALRRTVPPQR